jgi:ribonuclease HI
VEGSRRFLLGYLESLLLIKQHPEMDLAKGKMVVSYNSGFKRDKDVENGRQKPCQKWFPPRPGEVKLNVDGSWSSQGTAGAGMIIRDHTGAVIVAACKSLQACQDATEAELEALEEGMKLALLWTTRPVVVETDCASAASTAATGGGWLEAEEVRAGVRLAEPVARWVAREGVSTAVATVSTGAAAERASDPRRRVAGAKRSATGTWRRAGAARQADLRVKMKTCGTTTAVGSSGVSHRRGGRSRTDGRRRSLGSGNNNLVVPMLGGRATVLVSRVRETEG